jgi:hypothetical protein
MKVETVEPEVSMRLERDMNARDPSHVRVLFIGQK